MTKPAHPTPSTAPAAPASPEQQPRCAGPFVDARECPVHAKDVYAAAAPTDTERLAEKLGKFGDEWRSKEKNPHRPESEFEFQFARFEFLRRECLSLMERVRQQDADWLSMLREIAKLSNDDEWEDAADSDLLAEFDPWQVLRETVERVRTAEQVKVDTMHHLGSFNKKYNQMEEKLAAALERVRELEGAVKEAMIFAAACDMAYASADGIQMPHAKRIADLCAEKLKAGERLEQKEGRESGK